MFVDFHVDHPTWYMPYHLTQAKVIQIFWMGSVANQIILLRISCQPSLKAANLTLQEPSKKETRLFASHVHNKWILDQYDQCLHDNPGLKLWMEKMYLVELRGGGMISGWQWFPFKDSLLLKRSPIRIHVSTITSPVAVMSKVPLYFSYSKTLPLSL